MASSGVPMTVHDSRLATALAENERLHRELERQRTDYAAARSMLQAAVRVACDFSELTAVLSTAAEGLLRHVSPAGPARADADRLRAAASSAGTLREQLGFITASEARPPGTLDVGAVVAEAEPMLRRLLPPGVRLVTELDEGLGPVTLSPGQLEAILVDLVAHAGDAAGSDGEVSITGASLDVGAGGRRPGRYVALSVNGAGHGSGGPPRPAPNGDTAVDGRPGGRALQRVNDVVTSADGWVDVAGDAVGPGLVVCLPQTGASRPAPARASEDRGAPPRQAVLVVDEQPHVLRMLCEALEGSGYVALEAKAGDEAARVSAAHAGPIDLVVVAAGGPGIGLVRQLRERRPHLRALYVAGKGGGAATRGAVPLWKNVLERPFTMDAFARKVREVLREAGGPAR
jgi:two-component system cell cycle sensor histidine kinase/response regulator CckA